MTQSRKDEALVAKVRQSSGGETRDVHEPETGNESAH